MYTAAVYESIIDLSQYFYLTWPSLAMSLVCLGSG